MKQTAPTATQQRANKATTLDPRVDQCVYGMGRGAHVYGILVGRVEAAAEHIASDKRMEERLGWETDTGWRRRS